MNRHPLVHLLLVLAAGLLLGMSIAAFWLRQPAALPTRPAPLPTAHARQPSTSRPVLYWANPMNPEIHADHPMKDSMGMNYIPVYATRTGATPASGLQVDPRTAQNLGVRLITVQQRVLGQALHTVGTVAVDENRIWTATPRYAGWIVRQSVHAVGDPVRQGQVLAEIYSPDLYSAEQEYLIALHQNDNPGLAAAARDRLHLLGLPDSEIDTLAHSGKARHEVALRAPAAGVVTRLEVRQGSYVSPQTPFCDIANLQRVWVDMALYDNQLPWVASGDPVQLESPSWPGQHWHGTIRFIYPTLDPRTRTVSARLSIDNPHGTLRPGMYVEALVTGQPQKTLAIPRSAVLHGEQGDFVMLAQGQGHFLPVQVRLGAQSGDFVGVSNGLAAGDRIAESAQFLLYAESAFQSVKARMLGGNTVPDRSAPIRHGMNGMKGGQP